MSAASNASIDGRRLKALLDGVNRFGHSPETGGFSRPGFSAADRAARRWFAGQMAASGLAVSEDGAGNLFGRWGAAGIPAILAGSHLDTVPQGGAFDGALGVCVALECVRAMQDAGLEPAIPVEVVATSDEEGRFGGMLGSQAIAGQVTRDWIETAVDAGGVRLTDAMTGCGLDPAAIMGAARGDASVRAWLEMHIEQGPVLEHERLAVGIVDRVSGVCNWQVTLTGIANHSGTTPMDMRADAFAGLAELAAAIPALVRTVGGEQSRVTIGKVNLTPNTPHTIPGRAVFSLIIRDTDEAVMRKLCAAIRATLDRTATRHGLAVVLHEASWLAPTALDPGLAAMLEEEAERLGLGCKVMPSGAGHDAQTMQALCPAALIFVPSRSGISHAPEEWTDWPDIESGAALMLAGLARLCGAE